MNTEYVLKKYIKELLNGKKREREERKLMREIDGSSKQYFQKTLAQVSSQISTQANRKWFDA